MVEAEEDSPASLEDEEPDREMWADSYPASPLHEPPPSRSIPYKLYLRRFQLALPRGSTNPNSGIRFVAIVRQTPNTFGNRNWRLTSLSF
jgi:hypothetical protein